MCKRYNMTGRLVIIGDIHGDALKLIQCLKMSKVMDDDLNWIGEPNVTVVQLGDQVDSRVRTSTPYKAIDTDEMDKYTAKNYWEYGLCDLHIVQFMDQLAKDATLKDGKVISILGNHELSNVMGDFMYVSPESMKNSGNPLVRYANLKAGLNGSINQILAKRPVVYKEGPYLFCHGFIKKKHIQLVNGDYTQINLHMQTYLQTGNEENTFMELFAVPDSILWGRDYLNTDMEEDLDYVLKATGCTALFVGHTVVGNITPLYGGKLWLMDVGMSRAIQNSPCQILQIIQQNGIPQFQKLELR